MHDLTPIKDPLLKPTATIHVGNKLSFIERKLFNAIIWHSQKNRFAKHIDTIALGLLMPLIGLERSKNFEVIKQALETLTTTPILWNTLKQDRTTDWGICTFLAGAELTGGKLRYSLNPLLIEKINNPTLFAKIQLFVQTQFSSKYTLALYEFLLDELDRTGNHKTHEVQAPLDTVRHVLQFDGAYKHLNRDVLRPCVREINQHSDIAVGYRGVREGRAVTAILFAIERTARRMLTPLDDLKAFEAIEEIAFLPNDTLTLALVEKGVERRKAKALVATYDEARIRDNMAYVEQECAAGKVKNCSAYLIRAIEADYRPKKSPTERRREKAATQQQERQAAQQAVEALEHEWKQYRAQRVRERFHGLPAAEQESMRQAFITTLQQTDVLLYRRYQQKGFNSHLVEAQFFATISDALLVDPDEISLAAYRVRRDNDARTRPGKPA